MTKNKRINISKLQLANIMIEIAHDLRSGTDAEWDSVTDMFNATMNNIKHDFISVRPIMRKRLMKQS